MNKDSKLVPFVVVHNRQPITPYLITTREYGRWGLNTFDEYTAQLELFKKESKDGIPTQVLHPGSRLGVFFRDMNISDSRLFSVYVKPGSYIAGKLEQYKLATNSDCNFIQPEGLEVSAKWIRCYTPEQLELYIKSSIDKSFKIAEYLMNPIQITVKDSDLTNIYMPSKVCKVTKKLF